MEERENLALVLLLEKGAPHFHVVLVATTLCCWPWLFHSVFNFGSLETFPNHSITKPTMKPPRLEIIQWFLKTVKSKINSLTWHLEFFMTWPLQLTISHPLNPSLPSHTLHCSHPEEFAVGTFLTSSSFVCLPPLLHQDSTQPSITCSWKPFLIPSLQIYPWAPFIVCLHSSRSFSLCYAVLKHNPWNACLFPHAPFLLQYKVYYHLDNRDNVLLTYSSHSAYHGICNLVTQQILVGWISVAKIACLLPW